MDSRSRILGTMFVLAVVAAACSMMGKADGRRPASELPTNSRSPLMTTCFAQLDDVGISLQGSWKFGDAFLMRNIDDARIPGLYLFPIDHVMGAYFLPLSKAMKKTRVRGVTTFEMGTRISMPVKVSQGNRRYLKRLKTYRQYVLRISAYEKRRKPAGKEAKTSVDNIYRSSSYKTERVLFRDGVVQGPDNQPQHQMDLSSRAKIEAEGGHVALNAETRDLFRERLKILANAVVSSARRKSLPESKLQNAIHAFEICSEEARAKGQRREWGDFFERRGTLIRAQPAAADTRSSRFHSRNH